MIKNSDSVAFKNEIYTGAVQVAYENFMLKLKQCHIIPKLIFKKYLKLLNESKYKISTGILCIECDLSVPLDIFKFFPTKRLILEFTLYKEREIN